MSSSEHRDDWSRVRSCLVVGKISDVEGDYLWVRIDPPVIGQPYGLGDRDIADVLFLPHYEGTSLFPISEFPLAVYIFRVLDERVFENLSASPESLILAAWGEIYATREAAEEAARRRGGDEK